MKKLYWVYFESANYAGYGEHVAVWATSPEDAEVVVNPYAEEFYMEQDIDNLDADGLLDEWGAYNDCFSTVIKVEEFGPEHKDWEFYTNPKPGHEKYATIGSPD